MTQVMTPSKDTTLADYARFVKTIGNDPAWLKNIRTSAISRFQELDFPTDQDEEWRFTPVDPLVEGHFTLADGRDTRTWPRVPLLDGMSASGYRLLFVNGRYHPQGSATQGLPKGAVVTDLPSALKADPSRLERHLARVADRKDHVFTSWNTAFLQDGALIYIPKGVTVERPIFLNFIAAAAGDSEVSHPRVLIVAEPGSRVSVVETYVGSNRGAYFTNGVTEIEVGEGAGVDHIKVQVESLMGYHIAAIQVHQGRNSSFASTSLSTGGALVRNEIHAALDGEGADCTLNGLYMVAGGQVVDHHTTIDHVRPHGTSREMYKGILDGTSRGVFHGKVIVRPDAQKTDAIQANKNLLLSGDALVHTKPQLEIFANDVKCKHGATIGQLDADALFYLRSRGIGPEEARSLLIYAFAGEMIRQIKVDPIRTCMEQYVQDHFGKVGAR